MKLLNNPEYKSIFSRMLIVQLLCAVLLFCFLALQLNGLNQKILQQNTALVGRLITHYPEWENEIITYMSHDASLQEIQTGKRILDQYGHNESLTIYTQPILNRSYMNVLIRVTLLFLIFFIPIILFISLELDKIYKKVRGIAKAAEKVVDGEYGIALPETNEGEFGILGLRFNQMAQRLKLSFERLQEDKIFLKNIIQDISHQLKTPLASLIMFNELLISKKDMDEATKGKFLLKSKGQLDRMEWLIVSLLKMARLEAGAIKFKSQLAKMRRPVQNAVTSLAIKAEAKNQWLSIEEEKEGIQIKWDIDWMTEAFTNIIKNCIEHTQEHGVIHIVISESAVLRKIVIKDNGEGIASKDLPHIFERFYRGSNAVEAEGVGIGLALSKKIIEGQGGTITVKSELGKGTTFEIAFLKGIL